MKQTAIRYGMFAALIILALSTVNLFIVAKSADYATQEVLGYLTIVLAMIFVFLGIRHFRDRVNDGSLSFGEGFKVGLLIALIPAVFFGLFDLLYTEVINPSWKEEYYGHYAEQLRNSTPPEKLAAELDSLEKQKYLFSKPFMQFLIMTLTVFIIGVIVTIISALSLRRNKPATA
jgi:hypothetical protein